MKVDYNKQHVLRKLRSYDIVNFDDDMKKIKISKEDSEKYVLKKLQFELEYCPIIQKEKTKSPIINFPEEVILPEETRL